MILSVACAALLASMPAQAASSPAGSYRCWSMNVGGRGGRCSSPPIVLHADGRYEMSREHGTWKAKGDEIVLSESKLRGPGHVVENKLIFKYRSEGWDTTVTYVHQADVSGATAPP